MRPRAGRENASGAAGKRQRAQEIARNDWKAALSMASSIDLMWYRVQSLCAVALSAPPDQVDAILSRCVREADAEGDRYRGVAVLKWVIDAARERGRQRRASEILAHALAGIDRVEPELSQGSALELLASAAACLSAGECEEVCSRLLDLAARLQKSRYKRMRKWGKSYVTRVMWRMYPVHPAAAHKLVASRFGEETAERLYGSCRTFYDQRK